LNRISESDIIKGCQAKDQRFQKALVLQNTSVLMMVAIRYTKNYHSAQDVLQESFVKIIQGIDKYEETGAFLSWMKKIVINTALSKKRPKREQFEKVGLEFSREQEIQPEAYERLNTEEIIELINTLPNGYREVFNLSAIEGFSHKEIGELLNISESTSRTQLLKARRMLQSKLIKLNKIIV